MTKTIREGREATWDIVGRETEVREGKVGARGVRREGMQGAHAHIRAIKISSHEIAEFVHSFLFLSDGGSDPWERATRGGGAHKSLSKFKNVPMGPKRLATPALAAP